MSKLNLAFAVILVCALGLFVRAADEVKAKAPTTKPSGARLFAPYSKLTSLSDEQKMQIREIHRKALAAKKDIEAKEEMDIHALLSDAQKKELKDIADKDAADKKEKAGAKMEEAAN